MQEQATEVPQGQNGKGISAERQAARPVIPTVHAAPKLPALELRHMPPRFLTVREASAVSTLSERSLKAAIAERALRVLRKGSRVIIEFSALEKFLHA